MREIFMPEDTFNNEMQPCVVARKKCGCYVAALVISNPDRFDELPEFRREAEEYGATLEIRPVRFVRNGGLTFDCKH
jgi:hypothetical protein